MARRASSRAMDDPSRTRFLELLPRPFRQAPAPAPAAAAAAAAAAATSPRGAPVPEADPPAAPTSAGTKSLRSKPSEVSIGVVSAGSEEAHEVVVDVAPGQFPTPLPTFESGYRTGATSPATQDTTSGETEPLEYDRTFFVDPVNFEESCLGADDPRRPGDDDDDDDEDAPPPTPNFDYALGHDDSAPPTYADESFECFEGDEEP